MLRKVISDLIRPFFYPLSGSILVMSRPKRQREPEEDILATDDPNVTYGKGLPNSYAATLIKKELKHMQKEAPIGISCGLEDDNNLFVWNVTITGPPDTPYSEGFFQAIMDFPDNFPNYPPRLRFTSEMWHPNIYHDGRVCISILHPPGEDKWGYESAAERWRPINNVESVLISIQSMLAEPNDESPANIDAAVMWRNDPKEFKKRVSRTVRLSQEAF
ncbi:putative Ubiquitin-conjugating enzyme E2 7 [Blattamonas nauphoetae]|uniref:Ubiquitin-conjugating enzyme E2 7 n=1 Tax=Blattamonas nauphoetae TaxID=2049346 RepID=A0ABQ9YMQ3_9EUKA|nr:putative Ubiquitin-conjugating enzyme E2 7 [Blattamonas nauphoetae]